MARSVAEARSLAAPVEALAEHDQLGGPAAQAHGQRLGEVVLAVQVALDQRQLLGHAERLPGGQDRDLGDRVGVRGQRGDQGVAGLVHGHRSASPRAAARWSPRGGRG